MYIVEENKYNNTNMYEREITSSNYNNNNFTV